MKTPAGLRYGRRRRRLEPPEALQRAPEALQRGLKRLEPSVSMLRRRLKRPASPMQPTSTRRFRRQASPQQSRPRRFEGLEAMSLLRRAAAERRPRWRGSHGPRFDIVSFRAGWRAGRLAGRRR